MPPPPHPIEHLEDFTAHAWCNALLSDPTITNIQPRTIPPPQPGGVSNTFFTKTLFTDDAIRAFLSMYRPGPGRGRLQNTTCTDAAIARDALRGPTSNGPPSRPSPSPTHIPNPDGPEALILISLGKAVDGGIDRLHGGVTASMLDQVMGILVSYSLKSGCATAELSIKYHKPITTPAVLLCRARIVREAGRWVETVAWVEDGRGTVFAEGRGAFVGSRRRGEGVEGKM
ncbi:hypothetical protein M011DRAFT_400776 [Sporormia fimetaria CBS 119925]|uniref:Thioesterase domain-containing protein n=1 Tax=Sporormia fimetaria CBS 119925 TaxID=1340428 RepID=A0A6A6VDK8_9PLEO|nr:hypothetical protein M011DRAFT_400776 [Sporormia fimetaria CBS 119925]